MKSVGVVTDSHSSMKPAEAEALGVMLLPMPFYWMKSAIMKM